VEYTAQGGDTLPGLAQRFNTTVEEILEANDFIPPSATTMPPGMPMQIPIYYMPLWGSPYRIIPDSYFVNGPLQVGFDTQSFVDARPGWLKDYSDYVSGESRSGAQIVDLVAHYYSVSPQLLLALLEYQSGALSLVEPSPDALEYPLGYRHWSRRRLYLQLTWAANLLNNGYYRYKTLDLTQLEYRDGRIEYFDPWQNAATVSLHNFFNTLFDYDQFLLAVTPEGFAATFADLFGDPWGNDVPHIPGSLEQPAFFLPFQPGDVWALTGGPHSPWGKGDPLAALDFAPPSKTSGCVPSAVWATAVASGVVVRSTVGEVMLDLDGDGDERTGWNVFYLHIASEHRVPLGTELGQGDPVGHPSCEGGSSTGTHIHMARKYNGEWIPAEGWDGVMAFDLEGWTAHNGAEIYLGTLTRGTRTVTSCTCSNAASFIQTDRQPPAGVEVVPAEEAAE
jgi:murein DD-endopeptidase MepM/ murein hydrolase activator NlpD